MLNNVVAHSKPKNEKITSLLASKIELLPNGAKGCKSSGLILVKQSKIVASKGKTVKTIKMYCPSSDNLTPNMLHKITAIKVIKPKCIGLVFGK